MKRIQIHALIPTILVLATPAAAQVTSRVSVDSACSESDGQSFLACVSAKGRFVSFLSGARNLVPHDTNFAQDVFVRDRLLGTTERVNVSSSGEQTDVSSGRSAISGDGRFVAFESLASNLVPGDAYETLDVFLRDRLADTTILVSASPGGSPGGGASFYPSISLDGGLVAFSSDATDLVPNDTNGIRDVFVRDVIAGKTWLVSEGVGGQLANSPCSYPAISCNGRYVAFSSSSDNLVPGDTNGWDDVFVRDLAIGKTRLASLGAGGAQIDGPSGKPAISFDGSRVAFVGAVADRPGGDTLGLWNYFVRDLHAGTTVCVSVGLDKLPGNGQSVQSLETPSISGDGRTVVFCSPASDLVAGDTNGAADVFLRDLRSGTTRRLSLGADGSQGNGDSQTSARAVSADGRWVALSSFADNLVPGDGNGTIDVFVATVGAAAPRVR